VAVHGRDHRGEADPAVSITGDMRRDFTYVDDVAEAVVRLAARPAAGNPHWSSDRPDPASSAAPWRVYNIGNHTPVAVPEVVRLIEQAVGKPAVRELVPMQPGDVPETCADVEDLRQAVGFAPIRRSARESGGSSPGTATITRSSRWMRCGGSRARNDMLNVLHVQGAGRRRRRRGRASCCSAFW